MAQDFNTPPPSYTPQYDEPRKKSNTPIIIAIIILIVLCCCCVVGGGFWYAWTYGDTWMEGFSRLLPTLSALA